MITAEQKLLYLRLKGWKLLFIKNNESYLDKSTHIDNMIYYSGVRTLDSAYIKETNKIIFDTTILRV